MSCADIATNLSLGRERRMSGILGSVFRMLDLGRMRDDARRETSQVRRLTIQNTAPGPVAWRTRDRAVRPRIDQAVRR